MGRLALNKSSLTRQTRQLKSYKEFLPSLDLKRRQLIAEQAKARKRVAEIESRLQALLPQIKEQLPMLSNESVELTDIVTVAGVELAEENVVGTWLPTLKAAQLEVRDYALLGKPHWVDRVVEFLKAALELRLERQVAEQRLELLDKAVRIITQRVNLFDKVLIPRTRAHIKKIQIFLSDGERAAVVRSKLAKAKRLRELETLRLEEAAS